MSLSSQGLDAFQEIAKSGGFSQASKVLNVSQSALSQRIKNLEEDMGLALFVRTPTGVLLTEQGEKLLRYCQTRDSLENELVSELNASHFLDMAGTLRLGCYSSIFRSLVIPALSPVLRDFPNTLCEFSCADVGDLYEMLRRSEVDFIITDHQLDHSNLESHILGQESFVLIESKNPSDRNDIFLDNNSRDRATEFFFRNQKKKAPKYRRSYFDDCYGIVEGVRAGLGRAIMPQHLVKGDKSLRLVRGYEPFQQDIVLHYHRQPYYSKLHQVTVETLVRGLKKYL